MRRGPYSRPVPSAFARDLMEDWREHGREAIRRARTWTPQRYLQLVAALSLAGIPDEEDISMISTEELGQRLERAMAALHAEGGLTNWLIVPRSADA